MKLRAQSASWTSTALRIQPDTFRRSLLDFLRLVIIRKRDVRKRSNMNRIRSGLSNAILTMAESGIEMSFAPMELSEDDKRWLAFSLAGALIAASCTAACDLAKTELAGWLARRREAKKAEQ